MNELNDTAYEMANKIVNKADFNNFLESLFPMPIEKEQTDRKIENVKTIRNNLSHVYNNTPDIQDFVGTAYGIINAVSDMVTHMPPMRTTELGQEKMFGKLIGGHDVIDKAYALLKK